MHKEDVLRMVDEIKTTINGAYESMRISWRSSPEDDSSDYYIEKAFVELLILVESIPMPSLYQQILEMFKKAKNNFGKQYIPNEGLEPYLIWAGKIYNILDGLEILYNKEEETKFIGNLNNVIEQSLYSISNKKCFHSAPQSESDLHSRIEMILKPIFPDLIHKPPIQKQIKNFIPDTGIPFLKTLIEYKFVCSNDDAKRVADEILADTRGYKSKDWKRIIFVIYETQRVKSAKDWKQLISECECDKNIDIIVLCGEDVTKKKINKNTKMNRKKSKAPPA